MMLTSSRRWLGLIRGCLLAFSLLLASIPVSSANSRELSQTEQKVLQKGTDTSWYSPESGERVVRSPKSRDRIDARDRHDVLEQPAGTNYRSGSPGRSIWGDFFQFVFSIWSYLILGALVVLLLIALLFALQRSGFFMARSKRTSPVDLAERDRLKVTDLPFELEQTQVGLLAQADEFRRRGDYAKAMVYLFSHLLVELDSSGLIRLERGKTNRSYLRELAPHERIGTYMQLAVRWFEHVFFGKNAMDSAAFDRLRERVPEMESWMKGRELQRDLQRDNPKQVAL